MLEILIKQYAAQYYSPVSVKIKTDRAVKHKTQTKSRIRLKNKLKKKKSHSKTGFNQHTVVLFRYDATLKITDGTVQIQANTTYRK